MKKLKSFTRDRDMLASVLNENTTCYITSKDKLFFWDDSDFENLRVLGDLDKNEEVIHEFTLLNLKQKKLEFWNGLRIQNIKMF